MGRQHPFIRVPAATPAEAVMNLLAHLDRSAVEGAIDALIERLDKLDGDADLEANGDERDGSLSEEDFAVYGFDGPGCPISDPSGLGATGEDDAEDDGVIERRRYRNRVRREACNLVDRGIRMGRYEFKAGRGLA